MFWKNKPLPKETDRTSGIIEELKQRDVYKQVIVLPEHLKWCDQNDISITEIVKFVSCYYRPMTEEYVKYLLSFKDSIMLAIVSKKKNIIYGLISGYVSKMNMDESKEDFVIVNFICVHSSFRKKNMSVMLIEELTRRYIEKGYNYGCFMSKNELDYPICKVNYYDRVINFNKMKPFMKLESGMEEKHFNVLEKPSKDYQLAKPEDYEEMFNLYNKNVDRYNVSHNMDLETFKKYFTTNSFIKTYIIFKEKITDFLCIRLYEDIFKIAELVFYTSSTEPVGNLVNEAIKIANSYNVDVLRVPHQMNVSTALLIPEEEDKVHALGYRFMKTNKTNYFYTFNWKIKQILPKQISFVMI